MTLTRRAPAVAVPIVVAGAVTLAFLGIGPPNAGGGAPPLARRARPTVRVTPPADPRYRAIAAAASYLAGRDGYTSFAVINNKGRIHGAHLHRTFVSASVVKAMLLVAYLREKAGSHQRLDDGDRSLLQPMIHLSDNEAATAVWERVGNDRLRVLARRAGMVDFSIEGDWASAQISAADQARYFFEMSGLIPGRFRHFANHLLSHIAGYESWGSRRSPGGAAGGRSLRAAGGGPGAASWSTRSPACKGGTSGSRSR